MAKVFLTGGSGFLGRYLIAALKDNGAEVYALARSATSAETVARGGAMPIAGDLDGDGPWTKALGDCEMVLHGAALLAPYGRYKDFFAANVLGTRRILSAAQFAGVRRFVQVGAAAVVMGRPVPMRNVDESAALQYPAFAPYIATKAIADRELLAASRNGFDVSVVRPPAIWGQGSPIAASIRESLAKGHFALIDHGRAVMSVCHAANVATGAVAALDRAKGGEAYFLADDEPLTFKAFGVRMVGANALKGVRSFPFWAAWQIGGLQQQMAHWGVIKNPTITRSLLRLIGKDFTVNTTKAKQTLGWTPKAHSI